MGRLLGWNEEFTGLDYFWVWFVPGIYTSRANGKLVLASCIVVLGWTASLEPSWVGIGAVVVMSRPGVLLGWKWEHLLNFYSCQVCQELEGPSVKGG